MIYWKWALIIHEVCGHLIQLGCESLRALWEATCLGCLDPHTHLALQGPFSPLGFPLPLLTLPLPLTLSLPFVRPLILCVLGISSPHCVFSSVFLSEEGLHEQTDGTEIKGAFLKMLSKHWLSLGKQSPWLGIWMGGRIFILCPFVPFDF